MPTVVYDYDPRKIPPDYIAAIGLVTACSAQTEYVVEMLIGCLLGIDAEYQVAVTTHMTAPLRDGVVRAVAEIRIDDLDALDRLDVLLDQIQSAIDKRNAIVHRRWSRHPTTGEVFTVKTSARGSVRSDLAPMSVDQIKSDAAFIYDAGIELLQFMIAMGLEPRFPAPRPRAHKTRAARKARRKKGG
ncbi:MAG TPA: hypothetical protein VN805_11045 [Caulobacteraceae bacterium]|nr:hypothetical protein [Caulobacteraceae bacterium]